MIKMIKGLTSHVLDKLNKVIRPAIKALFLVGVVRRAMIKLRSLKLTFSL